MITKGILTLSVGKKYNKQAKFLAKSCIINSPSLPRAIITDECDYFRDFFDIIIKYDKNMGNPFEVKLKLHLFTPFYETLFLDSDTLVYSGLRFFWDFFDENSVVYVGNLATEGKWYIDISKMLKHFNISQIPIFNSGAFLLRKDKIGIGIMDYAANLYNNHDNMEIPYFRGKMLPDEPFLSIALAKFNQIPIQNDYGRLGRSLISAKKIKLNITKGIACFMKDDKVVFPTVVHFVGGIPGRYFYFIEKLRLNFYYASLSDVVIGIMLPFIYCLEIIKQKIKHRQ